MASASASANGTSVSLVNASHLVHEQLDANSHYWDLSDLLGIVTDAQITLSGRTDDHYREWSKPSYDPASMPVKRVPLPQELVDQFNHMQCTCLMGLFTEIGRAYLTIDSTIFAWNYSDGSDLAYFDGLSEVILCVALVKPKPGLFQAHVKYLLVLTTPQQVVLLGVSLNEANGSRYGEMHLQPQPLFTVSSDNMQLLTATGTPDGRIFLGGKDGCLYEVVYQAQESWFSRKCRLVNHSTSTLSYLLPSFLSFGSEGPVVQLVVDASRNILYSLSEKGNIQVYDMGVNGLECVSVDTLSALRMEDLAAMCDRELDRKLFRPVVQIAPIKATESSTLHLLAVTQAGVRFYFTTTKNGTFGRPTHLSLVHVRLPPGHARSISSHRPGTVHATCHREGSFLVCSQRHEDVDTLWLLDSDSFPNETSLTEAQHEMEIPGRVWALQSVHDEATGYLMGPQLQRSQPMIFCQHIKPPPKFVLLTNQGTSIVTKLRPVDQLEKLLVEGNGADTQALREFVHRNQPHEACAMCLILACSAPPQVRVLAEQAYLRYGGEPLINMAAVPNSTTGGPRYASTPLSSRMPTTAGAVGSPWQHSITTPQQQQQQLAMGQSPLSAAMPLRGAAAAAPATGILGRPVSGPEVVYSHRLRGLVAYFSRLVGPLWDCLLVQAVVVPGQGTQTPVSQYYSSIELDGINWLAKQMHHLNEFLDGNAALASAMKLSDSNSSVSGMGHEQSIHQRMLPHLRVATDTMANSPIAQHQLHQKIQAEAMAAECNTLRDLSVLFHRTNEVLCLWRVLCEYDLGLIVSGLSNAWQEKLRQTKFAHLIVDGRDLCSALIAELTKRFLSDRAATEALSARLRQHCPSLFSADDAVVTQAADAYAVAKTKTSATERHALLEESLKLYSKVSHHLPLAAVCAQYSEVHFFNGLVDLCLSCAAQRDPQSLALHHFRQQQPYDDLAGKSAFSARWECYECVVKCLDDLLAKSTSGSVSTMSPSSPVKTTDAVVQSAAQHLEDTLRRVLMSSDELMHIEVYDWLIRTHQSTRLLEVTSPYLDAYLTQAAMKEPADDALGLLWKYYERTQNFAGAAQVLGQLADRPGVANLQQRVGHLSHAVMCAKSCNLLTTSSPAGQSLHDLEEKLEVARIQLQLQAALRLASASWTGDKALLAERLLAELDGELMDISKLYGDYADHYGLSECKLAIVHCAGHHDPALVETLWREIIDEELTQSRSALPDVRAQSLTTRIVYLGQLYSQSQRYFPVGFLVKVLEEITARQGLPLGWVAAALKQIGLSTALLLNVYDRLFKAKDPCWQAAGRPLHVLNVIHNLLSSADLFTNLLPAERSQLRLSCLQAVTSYLVELQSLLMQDDGLTRTVTNFKQLQAKFQS